MGDIVDMGDVTGANLQRKQTIKAAEQVLEKIVDGEWQGAVGILAVVITKDSLVDFAASDSVDEGTAITLATVVSHALCPLLIGDEWEGDDGA